MVNEVSLLWFMLWFVGNLACFVIVLLVLRFAAKLKWLTAICLSVFAATFILIVGLRTLVGVKAKIGSIFLLPAVVCSIIMIIQFFRWVISGGDTIVNTDERDRILKMMEEGKINTEEGTELLDAIGRSSALRGEEKFSRVDMVMLIGVALSWFFPAVGVYSDAANARTFRASFWLPGRLSRRSNGLGRPYYCHSFCDTDIYNAKEFSL
ncbi:MAG: SHOCT-like domain-containing protein [Planctomycetota bacterium]